MVVSNLTAPFGSSHPLARHTQNSRATASPSTSSRLFAMLGRQLLHQLSRCAASSRAGECASLNQLCTASGSLVRTAAAASAQHFPLKTLDAVVASVSVLKLSSSSVCCAPGRRCSGSRRAYFVAARRRSANGGLQAGGPPPSPPAVHAKAGEAQTCPVSIDGRPALHQGEPHKDLTSLSALCAVPCLRVVNSATVKTLINL